MSAESKKFFRIKVTRDNGTSFEKLVENCLAENRGIQPDKKKYQKINLNK